jgi:hypothetical protein
MLEQGPQPQPQPEPAQPDKREPAEKGTPKERPYDPNRDTRKR